MDWDYYRKKAMECLRTAEQIREPTQRSELLGIAQAFMLLAKRAATGRDEQASHRLAEGETGPEDRVA